MCGVDRMCVRVCVVGELNALIDLQPYHTTSIVVVFMRRIHNSCATTLHQYGADSPLAAPDASRS